MNDIPSASPLFDGLQLGTGTWSWGDRLFWSYGLTHTDQDAQAAFQSSLEAGIRFFDTSESYGQGKSELLLGQFMHETGSRPLISTKFFPYPWRLSRSSLLSALRHSLARLDLDQVDLYQLHLPLPPLPIETWMEAMAEAVESGLAGAIGVSNCDRSQMERAQSALARHNISLTSNQVEYSLINRRPEKDGLLEECKKHGIVFMAYSPLGQGLLTGKYTTENLPLGIRSRRYNRNFLNRIQPLIALLREIGNDREGKSPAQVAINWLICKGAFPIPGAKNEQQLLQNVGALGWRLSEEEIADLDEVSEQCQKE